MRNYKKEAEWGRKKYIEIRAKIDKTLAVKLKEKLKLKGISIASWIRENAKAYINSD